MLLFGTVISSGRPGTAPPAGRRFEWTAEGFSRVRSGTDSPSPSLSPTSPLALACSLSSPAISADGKEPHTHCASFHFFSYPRQCFCRLCRHRTRELERALELEIELELKGQCRRATVFVRFRFSSGYGVGCSAVVDAASRVCISLECILPARQQAPRAVCIASCAGDPVSGLSRRAGYTASHFRDVRAEALSARFFGHLFLQTFWSGWEGHFHVVRVSVVKFENSVWRRHGEYRPPKVPSRFRLRQDAWGELLKFAQLC